MGHHQAAVVEHEMADEPVEEVDHLRPEVRALGFELLQRLGQPVRHLDLAASHGPQELVLVVAGYHERRTVRTHAHHQPQDARRAGAPVDEVSHEQGPATGGMARRGTVGRHLVPKLTQQGHQLVATTVDIADDVEGTMIVALVVPQSAALDLGGLDVVRRVQNEHPAEAFALEPFDRAPELLALAMEDLSAEITVRPRFVTLSTDTLGQVEDDGDG